MQGPANEVCEFNAGIGWFCRYSIKRLLYAETVRGASWPTGAWPETDQCAPTHKARACDVWTDHAPNHRTPRRPRPAIRIQENVGLLAERSAHGLSPPEREAA